MNLEALESFRIFAKTLNFTRTAEARHLTQPALHKQIKSLGESLGTPLYRREGRSLVLTEAGEMLARFSSELGDRIGLLKRALQGSVAEAKVTLVAGRGSYLYLLGGALESFQEACPGRIQLLTRDREGSLQALRMREAQLGVTVLEELPKDLRATLLMEVEPHLIVASDHSLAGRRSLELSALDGLALICPGKPSLMREMIAQRLADQGLQFNPVVDASGWDLMMHFASLGLGAAIVNGCCRAPEGTVAIPIKGLPRTRYYLLAHPDELQTTEWKSLRECIIEQSKRVVLF